jgi:hypothetical protein
MGNKRTFPKIKNVPKIGNINKDKITDISYPIFCFKHLQKTSIKGSKDADFLQKFIFRLKKLAELGWEEIRKDSKHGFGTEDILVKDLKPKVYPPIMTPDVTHLKVFRASGDNRPFLGIQNKDVFHVIFIETRFGDIYDH